MLALVLFLGVYFYFVYFYKSGYSWYVSYNRESREPYGTWVLSELLNTYHPGHRVEIIRKSFRKEFRPSRHTSPANYLFIGHEMYLDSAGVDSLFAFVEKGNKALIACPDIPYQVRDKLELICYDEPDTTGSVTVTVTDTADEESALPPADTITTGETYEMEGDYDGEAYICLDSESDSVMTFGFFDDSLAAGKPCSYDYRVEDYSFPYPWTYIYDSCLCERGGRINYIGYIDSMRINFFRVAYGEGYFYFHLNPIVFTNYHLLKEDKMNYASGVFSAFHEGPVIWDEASTIFNYKFLSQGGTGTIGQLGYILSQAPLRWAWYLLLFAVLLFMIFHARRRQRIIPVKEPHVNTSLEFVQTIGRLYYQQQDHTRLCQMQMKLFLGFIRSRYFLSTSQPDEELIRKLAMKSLVPVTEIEPIFKYFTGIRRLPQVSEELMLGFHEAIENFYKKCK